jgi:hypothetical protein
LIRYDARRALTVFAPALAEDGQWHEIDGTASEPTHSFRDVVQALGKGAPAK